MIGLPPLSAPELESRITPAPQTIENHLMEMVTSADETINLPVSHLTEAGGKHLCPVLTLLTVQLSDPALAAIGEEICDAGVAVELTHTATFYHDDVMDEVPLRRGAPSVQTMWDNSTVILTGDILVAQASQPVAALGPEAVIVHAKTSERLCMSQLHEALPRPAGTDPVDHYTQVLADKTGSLIAVFARYGAILTGIGTRTEQIMEESGERIGVVFQLTDNIIDLMGDSATIGKTLGTNPCKGVDTMPVFLLHKTLAVGGLDTAGQATLSRLSNGDLSDDAFLSDVVARLREHPVLTRTREMVMDWAVRAMEGLERLKEAVLDGTRQRLAQAGTEGGAAVAAMIDAGGRVRQVRVAMKDFVRILVDCVARASDLGADEASRLPMTSRGELRRYGSFPSA